MRNEQPLGQVRLVGAGPGAADLLTVRALRAIEGAQALLYDALIPEDILALAPRACVKIETGKRAGRPSMKQETIHRLMLRLVKRGLNVVRLKGGDPSIFGRVGEEIAFLRGHGVETEVVPGVTAACAAAAQFGFPLTHRGEARRVVFATARTKDGQLIDDWNTAADPEATLAIYMGASQADAVFAGLIIAGRRADTPVMVVENAGRPETRCITGTLTTLKGEIDGGLAGPVLIVVGEVTRRGALNPWQTGQFVLPVHALA